MEATATTGRLASERARRLFISAIFTLAGLVLIAAPVLAVQFSREPFPGFLVEPTLVINGVSGPSWLGPRVGLVYPLRVFAVNNRMVRGPADWHAVMDEFSPGDKVSFRITSAAGIQHETPAYALRSFPLPDLLRLFGLPYIVALAFFITGVVVYGSVRQLTSSVEMFAITTVCAAISTALTFDLSTTHAAPNLWMVALSQQGGALLSLGMTFPEPWPLIRRYPRLVYAPFAFTAVLLLAQIVIGRNPSDPWAYVTAWRMGYYAAGAGILLFLGQMLLRLWLTRSALIRFQALMVLLGSALAFLPTSVFFIAPIFGYWIDWHPVRFLPWLLFFPLSIAVAILRYHLWDIQVAINRALVYATLTPLLGGVFLASILILQGFFTSLIGGTTPLAVALSTLGTTMLFNPLRNRVQSFIDKRFFRTRYDAAQTLSAFSAALRDEVDLGNVQALLTLAARQTVHPESVELCSCHQVGTLTPLLISDTDPLRAALLGSEDGFLVEDAEGRSPDFLERSPGLQLLHQQKVTLSVPLISQGELVAVLNLGRRLSGQPYSLDDRRLLATLAAQAAPAMRIAQLALEQKEQALARQRMEQEMRIASIIQHTFLPRDKLPTPGWAVETYYAPARAVGGDFYDYFLLQDGRLGIVAGDVTDKGVPAALVMTATRTLMRSIALQGLPPGEVLARANNLLDPDIPEKMFVTCLYLLIEPNTGRVQFANAGHNLPYVRRGDQVLELRATGMPLGLMPGNFYEEGQAQLFPGDCVLLYSDGLVEAHNVLGEMFGFPRLKETLAAFPKPYRVIERLLESFSAFTGQSWEQEDDVTLLTIHVDPARALASAPVIDDFVHAGQAVSHSPTLH